MNVYEYLDKLAKGQITTGVGGQLTIEQSRQFITTIKEMNGLLKKIRTISMATSKYQLNILEVAGRLLRRGVQGNPPAELMTVTTTPRELSTTEIILPYDITFDFLEENIEGNAAESTINALFAKLFGNDLLDLSLNGNSSLPLLGEPFLGIMDGLLKKMLADTTVHDYTLPASITSYRSVFKSMLKLLPEKWKINKSELVFLVPSEVEEDYKDEIAQRQTTLGDTFLQNDNLSRYNGVAVEPVAYLPSGSTPKIVLTSYNNLAIGIERNMRIGRQVQERKRAIEYTITAKVDTNYVIGDLIVLGAK